MEGRLAGCWFALDVDYEMYGKGSDPVGRVQRQDRANPGWPSAGRYLTTARSSTRKAEDLRRRATAFGRGVAALRHARIAFAYYMYQAPRRARRLYFDVIPRAIDDYLASVEKRCRRGAGPRRPTIPPGTSHDGKAVDYHSGGVSFGMLLNRAGVATPRTKNVLWAVSAPLRAGATPETPYLDRSLSGAVAYYEDFVKSEEVPPTAQERAAPQDLPTRAAQDSDDESAEFIQNEVYEAGKRHFSREELRQWFKTFTRCSGQRAGPAHGRSSSFTAATMSSV